MVLLLFSRSRTEPTKVNPNELSWSVMFSFGTAFIEQLFHQSVARQVLRRRCLLSPVWLNHVGDNVGDNSTQD